MVNIPQTEARYNSKRGEREKMRKAIVVCLAFAGGFLAYRSLSRRQEKSAVPHTTTIQKKDLNLNS